MLQQHVLVAEGARKSRNGCLVVPVRKAVRGLADSNKLQFRGNNSKQFQRNVIPRNSKADFDKLYNPSLLCKLGGKECNAKLLVTIFINSST